MKLGDYALGQWVEGTGKTANLIHAVAGEKIGEASSDGLDFAATTDYARRVGGPTMRKLMFYERAAMLKALA